MSTGKTYSTKYLLDSNNNRGAAGQVLSTTSTGIDWVDANTVPGTGLWLANGNDIYNSNSGNVGIGITSPSQKLQVDGGATALNQGIPPTSGTTQNGILRLTSGSSVYGETFDFGMNVGTTYAWIQATNKASLAVNYNLALNPNGGNVGIGTASPDRPLSVVGGNSMVARFQSTNTTSFIQFSNTVSTADQVRIGSDETNLVLSTNYIERMRIDNVGAVLIGGQPKIDTATKLQVGGNDSGVTSIWSNADDIVFEHNTNLGLTFATPNNAAATIAFADPQSVQAGWIQYLHDVDAMRFGTNGNNERMRIDSNGNVGIGTSNPLSQLSIGSNAITTKKPTVIIADGVAGGSLVIRGLSPILSFDRTGANPENKILMDGAGLEFKTGTLDAEGDVDFKIKLDGKLQAPAYTQGFLQSDASGNIEISGGGTLPGGPYLPLSAGSSYPLTGALHFGDAFNYIEKNASSDMLMVANRHITFSDVISGVVNERMRIEEGGNVGIGTTGPEGKLNIETNAESNVPALGANTTFLKISNTGGAYGAMIGQLGTGNSYIQSQRFDGTATAYNLLLQPNGGNVGIGTTTPQEPLDVNTNYTGLNVDNTAAIFGNDIGTTQSRDTWIKMRASSQTTDRSWAFGTNQSGDFRFNYLADRTIAPTNAAASTLLTIKNTGNVGIGTTLPGSKLTVSGSFSADTGFFSNELTLASNLRLQSNITILNKAQTSYISFATRNTSGSEAVMDLTNVGSINGGAAGPYLPLAGGTMTGTGVISWDANNSIGSSYLKSGGDLILTIDSNNNQTTAALIVEKNTQTPGSGSELFRVQENGNVGIGTTSPDGKLDLTEDDGPTALYMNNFDTAQTSAGDVQNRIIMKGLYWSGSTTSQLVETRINSVHQLADGNGGSALTFMTQTGGSGVVEQMRIDKDGNVGIGLTPNASYSKLQVKAPSSSYGFDLVGRDAGSNGESQITFWNSNQTTQLSAIANISDNLIFYTSTAERMRITSAGDVQIVGNRYLYANPSAGSTTIGAGFQLDAVNNIMKLWTNNTERMRITSGGNVGIGTTLPGTALAFGGLGSIWVNNDTTNPFGMDTVGGELRLFVGTGSASYQMKFGKYNGTTFTPHMTIGDDGSNPSYVGIGTASPGVKLDVVVSDVSVTPNAESSAVFRRNGNNYITILSNSSNEGGILFGNSTDNNDASISYGHNTQAMSFATADAEKMRIASNGGVGINTTNPTEKLEVNGNVKVQGDIIVNSDIELGPSSRIQLDDTPTASTASGSGTIVNWSVSESTTAGTLYTVKSNGGWTTTDADIEAKSTGMLALALSSNANLGMLLQGFFYKASHGFTIGLPLYISNTAGAFSTTRPTGANDYVRIIGYATSANYIYFDPDKTWVQVA